MPKRRKVIVKMLKRSLTTILIGLTLLVTISVLKMALYFDAEWAQKKCEVSKQNFISAQILTRQSLVEAPPPSPAPQAVTPATGQSGQTYTDPKYTALKEYHQKTLTLRQEFSCRKLFQADETEQERVVKHHTINNNSYTVIASEDVPNIIPDCDAFRTIRGYRTDQGSAAEREFPLAYIIILHKDFEHVERLLRALYMPQHSFCLHVDAKAPESLKVAVTRLAQCFPNVIMASDPQSVTYAHVTRLMADVVCMRDLLKFNSSWRYLINYAATEFPLRSNLEVVEILKAMHGLNDIHEQFRRRVVTRFNREHVVEDGKVKATKISLPPAPYNITVIKGQAYNMFSRDFLNWTFTDPRPVALLNWCNKTYSPDEHYWASLNDLQHNSFLNSPGGFKGDPDRKGYISRYISWQYSGTGNTCHGKVVHHICLFSALDLPQLVGNLHMAVNKFDLTLDPIAYSCMEEMLEARTKSQIPIDILHYKKMYFIYWNEGME